MMIEPNIEPHPSVPVTGFVAIDLLLSTADDHPALLRKMDEQYLKTPQYGSRSYATWFQHQGIQVGRKKRPP